MLLKTFNYSFNNLNKINHASTNCSKLFQTVPNCSKLFQTVPNCSKLFQTVLFLIFAFSTAFSQTNYAGMPPVVVCGNVNPNGFSPPQSAFVVNPLAICTDVNVTKWVKVNFHFMLNDNGTANFNAIDDGSGNTNKNAYAWSDMLIAGVNDVLANNSNMWLPKIPGNPNGNSTPNLPTRIRFLQTGIYFHNSTADMASYSAAYLNSIYGVNTDTEINYYFTRSQSGGIELGGNGIADNIPGASALSSGYLSHLTHPDWFVFHVNLFLHEVGHVLDLYHTWNEDDLCNDTPRHGYLEAGTIKCCYGYVYNAPTDPCGTWANISNNMMDYGQFPSAYTPCQIARTHGYLNGAGNQFVHSCNGCTPVNAFFDLSGCFRVPAPPSNKPQFVSNKPLFLNGKASVNEDKYKIEICEVPSIGNSTCSGGYYNSGFINGTIEKINLKSLYTFAANKVYKVELEVASSSCSGSSKMVKYFEITSGACNYTVPN